MVLFGGVDGRQEIGMMRAQLESTKFQIIQWLFGVVTGAGALGLGISFFTLLISSLYSAAQLDGVVHYSTWYLLRNTTLKLTCLLL
jgi:hypothetical protein